MSSTLPVDRLRIAPPVAAALAEGRAVVALESTILAHGLPYPDNLDVANRVEALVQAGGAVPATIAVLDGVIRIGLDPEGLERVARGTGIAKLSRRDLPIVLAAGGDGATTVAATMICAHLAGIAVFATGGIGGVHRGAETSFDISADLEELATTPVLVVSAGAKAILDLPKTLEVLETKGVPVIGYGTDRFPAFYTADSGLALPHRLDDPATVARAFALQRALGYPQGMVVANPIPADSALDGERMEKAIAEALARAAANGVTGKDLTPALLSSLVAATEGDSLAANIALVENNVRLATAIAVALRNGAA